MWLYIVIVLPTFNDTVEQKAIQTTICHRWSRERWREKAWKWNEWCFRPRFCTCKAILGRGHPSQMRWICYESCPCCRINHSNLLTSSPARYHCKTVGPRTKYWERRDFVLYTILPQKLYILLTFMLPLKPFCALGLSHGIFTSMPLYMLFFSWRKKEKNI